MTGNNSGCNSNCSSSSGTGVSGGSAGGSATGVINSIGKQRRQLFPEKLWELVNSHQGSGIRWSPSNNKCIEIERSKLERYLQTKFRSQNFDSFIRQLHFYGFKKCGNSYYHDKFQRDQPDRIHSMRRKYSLNMLASGGNQTASHNHRNHKDVNSNKVSASSFKTKAHAQATQISAQLQVSPVKLAETAVALPPSSPRAHQVKPWKEIKLYTVDSTGPDDSAGNFTNVRETNARATKDPEGHLKISIPRSLVNIAGVSSKQGPWPRSLVLECYRSGEQSILSAFFIYRLN